MKIYFCDIEKLSDKTLKAGYATLDQAKKVRVDRCQLGDRKKMMIASDMLTRKMIGEFLNIKPQSITFAHSSHGKPILPNYDVHFNVSHSGKYWVGCIDTAPCGIDIEVIREVKLKIAERFCNQEELQYIYNAADPINAFFTIWTRKEAYFKSIGCGIATVLSAVDVFKEDKLKTIYRHDYVLSTFATENQIEIVDYENFTN